MATWIDQTIRLTEEPEIDLNPETGEFEFVYPVPEIPGSRLTILVPRSVVERTARKAAEMLALLPAVLAVAAILS